MDQNPITEHGIRAALDRARTKLKRQQEAVAATEAEIAMFQAQLSQKPAKR